MKKIWKFIIISLTLSFLFSFDVCAAEVTEENFDYGWYLEKHPDLAAVIDTNDKTAIWSFYQNIGKPAGWNARRDPEAFIFFANFDYERYAAENPDVAAIFGLDARALFNHYKTSGIAEGRKAYSIYEEQNALRKAYEIAEQVTAGCVSDKDKVKAVHDWLVMNVAYDYDNYLKGTIPDNSYSVIGPMLYGKAVCQGYADVFNIFMEALGIECKMITGTADNGSGVWGGHAWNKVKVDGNWYYIDVTWDDPVPDRGGKVYWYQYYLTTDAAFGGNHRPEND